MVKLIKRDFYLDQLKNVMSTPDIKVITGVRRSGKSKLMDQFIAWLKMHEKQANIIHIDFNALVNEPLKEYHALNDYVEAHYLKSKHNYLFIDEVQMCANFELTINSLHASGKYDIYVTGSNAFLLSSDLATLFTGRTFAVEVFPFSFKEYMQYYKEKEPRMAFDKYLRDGGMAGSYLYEEQKDKYKYINDVFDTLILRDINKKYKIRNTGLMNKLVDFMMDNIANLSSASKIAETLTRNKDKVNHKTVGKYMEYLCNAFAFYKVPRYDIRGKQYLESSEKYYLSDQAFRYAKLGTKNMDYGRVLENIVAVDLLRRGYKVYAGVLYKKEIDFVAIRHDEKIYIQVADNISEDKTLEREVSPLLKIRDGYPKLILARTGHEEYQYEGIKIIDIADWLI
jgi:predicted AAA+ superfamily ATPase